MNYTIDIILISDANCDDLMKLTMGAVRSATPHRVIVLESNPNIEYEGATTLHPEVPFNYNRYLNIGARYCESDYIFFGNNDVLFEEGWDRALIAEMRKHKIRSASPLCPNTHPKHYEITRNSGVIIGYEVYKLFCGWAFLWERSLYEQIGKMDESFTFWCSDNVVVEQLKCLDEKHMLVTSSVVNHIGGGSRTLIGLEDNLYRRYTKEALEKFNQRFDQKIVMNDEDFPKAKFLK